MKYMTMREYAERAGVTYEAVRQQVHRNAEQLEPYILKQGRYTFLLPEAIRFLDDHRAVTAVNTNEIVEGMKAANDELQAAVEALRAENAELKTKLIALHEVNEADKERLIQMSAQLLEAKEEQARTLRQLELLTASQDPQRAEPAEDPDSAPADQIPAEYPEHVQAEPGQAEPVAVSADPAPIRPAETEPAPAEPQKPARKWWQFWK